jgi:hypothetical protein
MSAPAPWLFSRASPQKPEVFDTPRVGLTAFAFPADRKRPGRTRREGEVRPRRQPVNAAGAVLTRLRVFAKEPDPVES